MSALTVYNGGLDLIEAREHEVAFGKDGVEAVEYVITREQWEFLERPTKLVVGFATVAGWHAMNHRYPDGTPFGEQEAVAL